MGTSDYELHPGQMVGEYRIERKIGEGGFGKVYAAMHPIIGKSAAVKILNPDLAKSEEMVSRFVAEARAVNQIRHRNIIDIFAFGTLPGGLHYFVMELLEGVPLDQYVKKNAPLDPAHALSLLWPVGRALTAAHKAGIAHRDLKPENVFLTFDQDGVIFPKLLDFGIAKLLHDNEMAHRTRTGMMMGTPIYMSPEQCRGANLDHRSDIYSFGIMTHEVLTGQQPFTAENLMDLLMKQVNEAPRPMSAFRADLPRSLDAPVLRMLEKAAERRPESMQAALDELFGAARAAGLNVPTSGQPSVMSPQPSPGAAPAGTVPGRPAGAAVGAPATLDTGAWVQSAGASVAVSGVMAAPAGTGVQTGPGQHATSGMQTGPGQHATSAMQTGPGQHATSGMQTGPGQAAYGSRETGPAAAYGAPQYGPTPAGMYTPVGAPAAAHGYPQGHAAAPTWQGAGDAAAPARAKSSLGGFIAIAAALALFFVVGIIGLLATWDSGVRGVIDASSVQIGALVPGVGTVFDHETTADLGMAFTAPGERAPRTSVQLRSVRRCRITVQAVGDSHVTRALVQYAESSVRTTASDGSDNTEASPTANRGFLVLSQGGAPTVTGLDGAAVGAQEQADVLEDVGELFRTRAEAFGSRLALGDTVSPSSELVVELLGLGVSEPGVTVRADNAVFRLASLDPRGTGKATFDVELLFVREDTTPLMTLSVPLRGSVTLDAQTGLPLSGTLNGPVSGTFTNEGIRFGVSGTMSVHSR